MNEKLNDKKITLTEEQSSRAAETLINAWLRGEDNTDNIKKDSNKNK